MVSIPAGESCYGCYALLLWKECQDTATIMAHAKLSEKRFDWSVRCARPSSGMMFLFLQEGEPQTHFERGHDDRYEDEGDDDPGDSVHV